VDNPTYIEIRDVLSVSNLQFLMENMKYCREKSSELQVRGRVRVQLRNADGTLFNNDFPSRESIMLHIASRHIEGTTSAQGEYHSSCPGSGDQVEADRAASSTGTSSKSTRHQG